MTRLSQRLRTNTLTLLGALSLCALAATEAHAQRFENLLGSTTNREIGQYGVRPVTTGGYIAVGSANLTRSSGSDDDVYVVRLNTNGTLAWSATYDINGSNTADEGKCIIECANGNLAVCGNTQSPNNCGLGGGNGFIMVLTPAGGVLSVTQYGAPGNTIMLDRLVEATVGNPMIGTAAGDLIACGTYFNVVTNTSYGYIMRTTAVGPIIWDVGYSATVFHDVIEATAAGAGGVGYGDVVAVGTSVATGIIARVDGNSGMIMAPPHGIATYGNGFKFRSVQEMQVGGNAGNLIIVGGMAPMGFLNPDIYVLKTGPNPCAPIIDAGHGDNGGVFGDDAWSVREVITPPLGSTLNNGNLVISGTSTSRTSTAAMPDNDALLLELDPNTLATVPPPFGAGYTIYGQASSEAAFSLHPVYGGAFPTDGFILCGSAWPSGALPSILAPGDPGQMYIIKTDRNGSSNCNDSLISDTLITPSLQPNCPNLPPVRVQQYCGSAAAPVYQTWNTQLCYTFPKQSGPAGTADEAGALATFPNPIRRGGTLQLACTVAESGSAAITITDLTGRTLLGSTKACVAGMNRIAIDTGTLAPGTYIVTVKFGEWTQSQKVVVIEH